MAEKQIPEKMFPDRERIPSLKIQAAENTRQGALAQEYPEKAEVLYRRALQIWAGLFEETGDPACAAAAKDLCESLAELSMEQGNMHGADVYYVKALSYESCRK